MDLTRHGTLATCVRRELPVGTSRSGPMVGGPLGDVEDHEFGGLDRGYPDDDVQSPVIKVVLGHGGLIAADKKRLFRRGALQHAGAPFVGEQVCDGGANSRPQSLAVRLKNGPLRPAIERVLQVDHIAPHLYVVKL